MTRNADIKPVVKVNESHGSHNWRQVATTQELGPSATDSTIDGCTYQTPCLVFKKKANLLRNGASHKTQMSQKLNKKLRNNTLDARSQKQTTMEAFSHSRSSKARHQTVENSPLHRYPSTQNQQIQHKSSKEPSAVLEAVSGLMGQGSLNLGAADSFLPTISNAKNYQTVANKDDMVSGSRITDIWKKQFERYPQHIQELYIKERAPDPLYASMMLPGNRIPEEDSYGFQERESMRRSHVSKKEFEVQKKLLGTSSIWDKSPRPRHYVECAPDLYSSFDTAVKRVTIPLEQQRTKGKITKEHQTYRQGQMSFLEEQQALFESQIERSRNESMV